MRIIRIFFPGLILAFPARAQQNVSPRYQDYLDRVRELGSRWQEITLEEGREGLIRHYRSLIDSNPGFDKNIELEARIADILTWDLPNDPAPQDASIKRFEAYESIIERYPASDPFMKQVRIRAGEASADIFPDKSAEIFSALIDDYPDEDVLRLRCLWNLGLNASKRGNKKEAEEFYARVLAYDAEEKYAPFSDERSSVNIHRHNAAVGLFWLAFENDVPPLLQLSLVEARLKKYPQIGMWHPFLVGEELEKLHRAVREEMDILEEGLVDSLEILPVETQPAAEDGSRAYDTAVIAEAKVEDALSRPTATPGTEGIVRGGEGTGGHTGWWIVLAVAGLILGAGAGFGIARRR